MEINGFNIEPQNGRAGTDIPISIGIAAVNEGLDRSIEIDAICGNKASTLKIIHEGKREVFNVLEGPFLLNDGSTFNVLK